MIVATSPNAQTIRQMQLLWGVKPIYSPYRSNSDEVIDSAIELAKLRGLIHEDDLIVLTAGMAGNRTRNSAHTNSIRVLVVD
jgi:pyruvate kinase